MPLIPLRPLLETVDKYHFAQGAFNVNAVAQAKAAIEVHEMFRSAAILQGADLANGFMGGQPIFSTIVEYSSHIPEFTKTPYHYESRECVNTAVVNIVNGTPVEDALQEAQDTLAFKMTE